MLTACEQQWQITNYTRNATFVVENLEGGGEFIKIVPLWRQVTIPFELSRLVVPLRSGPATLRVFSPPPPTVLPDEAVEIDNGLREHLALDEQAKYFLVLVALCEPRLRSSTAVAPPAIPAVVERLRSLPGFEGLTRTAVNYHIDYLFSVKLREYFPDTDGPESRTTGKREKLVDTAIKYDLVRPEHLMLLPERRTRNPEKPGPPGTCLTRNACPRPATRRRPRPRIQPHTPGSDILSPDRVASRQAGSIVGPEFATWRTPPELDDRTAFGRTTDLNGRKGMLWRVRSHYAHPAPRRALRTSGHSIRDVLPTGIR